METLQKQKEVGMMVDTFWRPENQPLCLSLLKSLVRVLSMMLSLPLYALPRRGRPVRTKAIHEMHPLAYTDALRGYLAMIIYTGHCMSTNYGWIPKSILAVPWLQFPFRGGHASVQMFYWISGYTVTYKIIGLIQSKQTAKLHDALVSAVFRRFFRLFLPVLPLILVTAIGVWLGIVQPGEQKAKLVGNNPIWFWIKDCGHFMNPFSAVSPWYAGNGEGSHLLFHTWSINTEFRSSMIKFAVCLGLSKVSTANRKLFYWLVIPAFTAWQAHYASMAFIGMWFAECRQERNLSKKSATLIDLDSNEKQEMVGKKGFSVRYHETLRNFNSSEPDRIGKAVLSILFLYSFVVMHNPSETAKMTLFPHNYLNLLVPKHWHESMAKYMHLGIGSVMMLYPLDRLTFLQKPLLLPFSQFLGELSFGIYAVHITIRWTVWEPQYEKWAKARYGGNAMDNFWIAFSGWCVMTVIVLWSAELFRRLDWRVVRFCSQLEKMLFE